MMDYVLNTLNFTGPIYPSLGNHESMPCDIVNLREPDDSMFEKPDPNSFDFGPPLHSHNWIWEEFEKEWEPFIKDKEALKSLYKYSYYTTIHNNTNFRIIALHSAMYDAMNWYTMANATDPLRELQFIYETL